MIKRLLAGSAVFCAGAAMTYALRRKRVRTDYDQPLLMHSSPAPTMLHKAPSIDSSQLAGRRVAIAYNLHQCPPGRTDRQDCYTIREKPRARVEFVTSAVVLHKPRFWVSRSSLLSIRKKRQREVCCYIVGTIASLTDPAFLGVAANTEQWRQIRFNPHSDDGFVAIAQDTSRKLVSSAEWCLMAERQTLAAGLTFGVPHGPVRKNDAT